MMLQGANFYDNLLAKTLTPLFLIGVIVLVAVLKLMRPGLTSLKRDKAISGAVKGVSLLIELVLPSVSTCICQSFVCDYFDDFPKGALRADYTVYCDMDSPGRAAWWSYSALMLLIYPIAMPCLLVAIFYVNRKEIDMVMEVWKHHDEECIANGESTSAWTIQDCKVYMAAHCDHNISGSVMALAPTFMKFDPSCWCVSTLIGELPVMNIRVTHGMHSSLLQVDVYVFARDPNLPDEPSHFYARS